MKIDAENISLLVALIALVVSIITLLYTAKAFLLKSGEKIKGGFGTCSSVTCEDKYIGNVLLENLKDRAVAIFAIYLQIGHNYFLKIDGFEDDPLILEPFKVFSKTYDPLDFYSINLNRIKIDNLLDNRHVKKKLVLSTSNGKCKVKSLSHHWSPINDYFKNFMTAIISPKRTIYKGKSYGINLKYIVEIEHDDGNAEIIPIYPEDYRNQNFRNFVLTQKSLESKEELEKFFHALIEKDTIRCKNINILDFETRRNEIYKNVNKKVIEATYYNWFMCYIIGPVYTRIDNARLKKANKMRNQLSTSPKDSKPQQAEKKAPEGQSDVK